MKQVDVRTMPAGREMDALVATKLGWESAGDDPALQWGMQGPMWKQPGHALYQRLPDFSTDYADTEYLVRYWRSEQLEFAVGYDDGYDGVLDHCYADAGYYCNVADNVDAIYADVRSCATLPLAMSRAFLLSSADED